MQVIYTKKSGDRKTGPIPASYYPRITCPTICPFRLDTCYGEGGNTRMHWDRLSRNEIGMSFDSFLSELRTLPNDTIWRSGIVGDFPRSRERNTVGKKSYQIVDASKGKRGYGYTHYPLNKANISFFGYARDNGFVVNISTNNVEHAIETKRKTDHPVTTVIHSRSTKRSFKLGGVHFLVCPHARNVKSKTTGEPIQCIECKLCLQPNRDSVICFPAHGIRKNQLDKMLLLD